MKHTGANVQLGPGLCLARVPRNGRNFEYLSGEDPYLGYTLVQPVIHGIQSQKVVANAKHYAMNNQETNRGSVSEEVDERTRFEMYYPAFAGAIEANVGSIMCSYNKINGIWSCENPVTLGDDLKNYSGFKGYVMSDWGATHSTSIMDGLDVEMPGMVFEEEKKKNFVHNSYNLTYIYILLVFFIGYSFLFFFFMDTLLILYILHLTYIYISYFFFMDTSFFLCFFFMVLCFFLTNTIYIGASFMNEDAISTGLKNGSIKQAAVDESVYRLFWSMFSTGVMDEPDVSVFPKNIV